jgi:hypothetical protein
VGRQGRTDRRLELVENSMKHTESLRTTTPAVTLPVATSNARSTTRAVADVLELASLGLLTLATQLRLESHACIAQRRTSSMLAAGPPVPGMAYTCGSNQRPPARS